MQNRAKCKLCNSVIESYHATDYVECKCGEISVDGGAGMRCAAINWDNFIRVDDIGNEIIVKVQDSNSVAVTQPGAKPNKKELLDMLKEMYSNIDRLPEHAKSTAINHYDFASLLLLLTAIFDSD